jgi:hypothetical protein
VTVAGDPVAVIACHCTECQRRTGSVFGVGAYYPRAHVAIDGASKAYRRDGQQGRKLTNHFCPECGTTVYWHAETLPDAWGIAVGAFGDPDFPLPARSVWEQSKHRWVELGPELQHFAQGSIRNPAGPSR